MINKIFKIEKSTSSHITLRILGIKIHLLRPELRKNRQILKEKYRDANITNLSEADGYLREIQLANLGLLKIIDSICKENNINYWLDFGTLLGAVRHKGFIPWDDDIDIGMIREDYEKFIELFKNGFETHPDLYCFFSNNSRNKCFIKVKHKKRDNLFVDIFPWDYYHQPLSDEEKTTLSNLISKIIKPPLFKRYKSVESIRKHFKNSTFNKILNKNSVDISKKPALFWGIDFPHRWANKVNDFDTIFPLSTINFENTSFPCPNNPDKLLKNIYGDYMTIPKDVYPRHSSYLELSIEEKEIIKTMAEIR